MPTYGYQCTECKHEFSVFQAMKDDPIEICPECGSKVIRLLYPVGIVFKGSGWYINDSRKPDTSDSAKAEKAETDKGSADKNSSDKPGSETKSDSGDSKPADTKSDGKAAEKPATPAPASAPATNAGADK